MITCSYSNLIVYDNEGKEYILDVKSDYVEVTEGVFLNKPISVSISE